MFSVAEAKMQVTKISTPIVAAENIPPYYTTTVRLDHNKILMVYYDLATRTLQASIVRLSKSRNVIENTIELDTLSPSVCIYPNGRFTPMQETKSSIYAIRHDSTIAVLVVTQGPESDTYRLICYLLQMKGSSCVLKRKYVVTTFKDIRCATSLAAAWITSVDKPTLACSVHIANTLKLFFITPQGENSILDIKELKVEGVDLDKTNALLADAHLEHLNNGTLLYTTFGQDKLHFYLLNYDINDSRVNVASTCSIDAPSDKYCYFRILPYMWGILFDSGTTYLQLIGVLDDRILTMTDTYSIDGLQLGIYNIATYLDTRAFMDTYEPHTNTPVTSRDIVLLISYLYNSKKDKYVCQSVLLDIHKGIDTQSIHLYDVQISSYKQLHAIQAGKRGVIGRLHVVYTEEPENYIVYYITDAQDNQYTLYRLNMYVPIREEEDAADMQTLPEEDMGAESITAATASMEENAAPLELLSVYDYTSHSLNGKRVPYPEGHLPIFACYSTEQNKVLFTTILMDNFASVLKLNKYPVTTTAGSLELYVVSAPIPSVVESKFSFITTVANIITDWFNGKYTSIQDSKVYIDRVSHILESNTLYTLPYEHLCVMLKTVEFMTPYGVSTAGLPIIWKLEDVVRTDQGKIVFVYSVLNIYKIVNNSGLIDGSGRVYDKYVIGEDELVTVIEDTKDRMVFLFLTDELTDIVKTTASLRDKKLKVSWG